MHPALFAFIRSVSMFKNKKSKYITGIILEFALIEMSMIFVGTYLQKSSSQNLKEWTEEKAGADISVEGNFRVTVYR